MQAFLLTAGLFTLSFVAIFVMWFADKLEVWLFIREASAGLAEGRMPLLGCDNPYFIAEASKVWPAFGAGLMPVSVYASGALASRRCGRNPLARQVLLLEAAPPCGLPWPIIASIDTRRRALSRAIAECW
jgi:hypothetical protein